MQHEDCAKLQARRKAPLRSRRHRVLMAGAVIDVSMKKMTERSASIDVDKRRICEYIRNDVMFK